MIRTIIALLLLAAATAGAQAYTYPAPYTCSRNFYVSTGGIDQGGCGTTQANACASIQGANNNIALQGGDCVNVLAGTYNLNYTMDLTRGGSSNQANGYVAYVGAPNHGSVLNAVNGGQWYMLLVDTNYLIIDGFEFAVNNATVDAAITTDNTNKGGIYNLAAPHHLMFLNNLIHDAIGGGVGSSGGDYFIYANNIIHDVSKCTPYGESAIHILWPQAIPGFTATLPWDTQFYHIQYIGNTIYNNYTHATHPVTGAPCGWDGDANGDNADNWQLQNWGTGPGIPPNPGMYPYHGIMIGNLSYGNGNRGVSANSGHQIDFYNNTTYNNGVNTIAAPPQYPSSAPFDCEILIGGDHVNVANNIFYANTATLEGGKTLCWTGAYGFPETNVVVNNNLFYNGSGSSGVTMQQTQNDAGNLASITASSANNKLAVNPLLNSPTTDFHPQATSPVLGAGVAISSVASILPGPVVNPDGVAINQSNIGAYSTTSGSTNVVAGPVSIAAGGAAAPPYIADAGYNGGTAFCCLTTPVDTSLVTSTTPAPTIVYQGQRFGPSFFYVVSGLTPGQNYTTILHFTEDFDTAVGQRQENITINGTQVLAGFDIFSAAGAQHKAVTRSFVQAADSTGCITINFSAVSGLVDPNAKIDAIRVLALPTAANQTASTSYATPVSINLAAGSTGSPLSAAVSGTPTGGTVSIAGLTATFTPAGGFSGAASFQFTLSGDGGTSNIATANITVAPIGALPPCTTSVECFQYIAGWWFVPDKLFTSNGSTSPPGANIIRCIPAGMRSKATIAQLATRVYNKDPNGHVQFAIYTNGQNTRPATYVATSASVPVSSAGPAIMALSANIQGGPGGTGFPDTFWICANTDSNTATFGSTNALGSIGPSVLGSATSGNVLQQAGNGAVITSLSCSGSACFGGSSTFGSFPASLAGTTWTEETGNKMPAVAFQFTSVP